VQVTSVHEFFSQSHISSTIVIVVVVIIIIIIIIIIAVVITTVTGLWRKASSFDGKVGNLALINEPPIPAETLLTWAP
jgi:hypothetical protein